MSRAIWILKYELADGSEYQYLDWFHTIHIPEKLARPGYLWASHFEGDVNAINQPGSKKTYLALFGGRSTRTFLDPSPSELKNMQDDLTRKMMANRRSSEGAIYTLEWSADELDNVQQPNAEKLDYFSISGNGNDEAVGAWAAQSLFPTAHQPDFNSSRTYKLISVTGNQKHGVICQGSP